MDKRFRAQVAYPNKKDYTHDVKKAKEMGYKSYSEFARISMDLNCELAPDEQ